MRKAECWKGRTQERPVTEEHMLGRQGAKTGRLVEGQNSGKVGRWENSMGKGRLEEGSMVGAARGKNRMVGRAEWWTGRMVASALRGVRWAMQVPRGHEPGQEVAELCEEALVGGRHAVPWERREKGSEDLQQQLQPQLLRQKHTPYHTTKPHTVAHTTHIPRAIAHTNPHTTEDGVRKSPCQFTPHTTQRAPPVVLHQWPAMQHSTFPSALQVAPCMWDALPPFPP